MNSLKQLRIYQSILWGICKRGGVTIKLEHSNILEFTKQSVSVDTADYDAGFYDYYSFMLRVTTLRGTRSFYTNMRCIALSPSFSNT
jgi:hypothetical protein